MNASNQWYEPRGKPLPQLPQQAAGNSPGEIKADNEISRDGFYTFRGM